MTWIKDADIKVFIHDWDAYGFTAEQVSTAIENAEARVKDELSPYFVLPADDEPPPPGLKSLVAQYSAYLLMRGRRVSLSEAEEAWVRELGKEVEEKWERIKRGELTIKGLARHIADAGEEKAEISHYIDPLLSKKYDS